MPQTMYFTMVGFLRHRVLRCLSQKKWCHYGTLGSSGAPRCRTEPPGRSTLQRGASQKSKVRDTRQKSKYIILLCFIFSVPPSPELPKDSPELPKDFPQISPKRAPTRQNNKHTHYFWGTDLAQFRLKVPQTGPTGESRSATLFVRKK